MVKKKAGKKVKGLTLHFMPYNEISKLDSIERIKKLLKVVLSNKVIILQGTLKPEEETRLIEDTMIMIGNIKGFKGVELAVIAPDAGQQGLFSRMRESLAKTLVGHKGDMTIIGPASVVKEMKKDPKKLEVMMR